MLWLGLGLTAPAALGQIVRDGTGGPAVRLHGPDYLIPASSGTTVGSNLFHSFSVFNLAGGETARFTGPWSVSNVFARITGGAASTIDGRIVCTIPNASFYLINPNGVVFGPGASLDVRGSFTVTTADVVRLGGHGEFRATKPDGSVLSSAPAAAFGFLGKPAGVSVAGGAKLAVNEGKSLSVVGGVIRISGQVKAPGGAVNVASLKTAGTVGANDLAVTGVTGAVVMEGEGSIDLDGEAAGFLTLRAGTLSMTDSSLSSKTTGAGNGAGMNIQVGGGVKLVNSSIRSDTSGPGRGGDVRMSAGGGVVLDGGSAISATTFGVGHGGNVSLRATSVDVRGVDSSGSGSSIFADSDSAGAGGGAGNVRVDSAGGIRLMNGANISSTTFGLGRGGSVLIRAGSLVEDGVDGNGFESAVLAASQSEQAGGAAGAIQIESRGAIRLTGGGKILSSTFGEGAGGGIAIRTGALTASGEDAADFVSGVFAFSKLDGAGGPAGNIRINSTGQIHLSGGARISSSTNGAGAGGTVRIQAGSLVAHGEDREGVFDSGVFASSNSAGRGGQAGDIRIDSTGEIHLSGGAGISSNTDGAGAGGTVRIRAGSLLAEGEDREGFDSGIFANSNSAGRGGPAGEVKVSSSGSIELWRGGGIHSSTFGLGKGGSISIHSKSLWAHGEDAENFVSGIFAFSKSEGAGGAAGDIRIAGEDIRLSDGGRISSGANGFGRAGSVEIRSVNLTLSNKATINVRAFGSDGGDIDLQSLGRTSMTDSGVSAEAHLTGGSVRMTAGRSIGLIDTPLTAQSTHGDGGNIFIDSPTVSLRAASPLTASAPGAGGKILLLFDALTQSAQSAINATGGQTAGTVDVLTLDAVSNLGRLPNSLQVGNARLEDVCSMRLGVDASSFIVTGPSGLPAAPGGVMSGFEVREGVGGR